MVPLFSIGTVQACRFKSLHGKMDLNFVGAPPGPNDPGWLTWKGTIKGDIEGDIIFWNTLSEKVGPNKDWVHFKEIWQIFDSDTNELLLEGYDEGYITPSKKYAMVGRVTSVSEDYEKYIGHYVVMFGTIYFVEIQTPDGPKLVPSTAPGLFIMF